MYDNWQFLSKLHLNLWRKKIVDQTHILRCISVFGGVFHLWPAEALQNTIVCNAVLSADAGGLAATIYMHQFMVAASLKLIPRSAPRRTPSTAHRRGSLSLHLAVLISRSGACIFPIFYSSLFFRRYTQFREMRRGKWSWRCSDAVCHREEINFLFIILWNQPVTTKSIIKIKTNFLYCISFCKSRKRRKCFEKI